MKQLLVTLILFCCAFHFAGAQTTLRGKVTDTSGQPLVGVGVSERGSANNTQTSLDGTYNLRVSQYGTVVVFRYIGFANQEITLGEQTTLDVIMQTDDNVLDQVVIVGSRRGNRVQTETAVPVDVINIGAVAPTSARTDLSAMLNYSAPSFNYTKQSGADGADHIDLATLRGLGPDQTLVLLNGKRRHQSAFVAVFGTRGRGNSGTDLGAIPFAAIDRVEILRDGASAQYGSDAIAGVINIVMKENVNRGSLDLGYSSYYDGKYNPAQKSELGQYVYGNNIDGGMFNAAANFGLPLGTQGGFVNMTLNFANSEKTYRQEIDGTLPTNIYRRAHGDASMRTFGGMFNADIPIKGDRLGVYAFGGFNRRESDAYAFTRNFSARPDRFPTDENGNLIEVPDIIKTASDGEKYYNPRILAEIDDFSAAAGVKGTTEGGWMWDVSHVFGQNTFSFFGEGTFNAGLGATPNDFNDGGFLVIQNTTNASVSKNYPEILAGFNMAYGAEFRLENYVINAGELASYANFDTLKASGAQGFPGYQPSDEVDASRNCFAGYADFELDITERWLVAAALRLENYSDFGLTTNFKLATRYKLFENFNLRGSVSTGYRAPSLQQINFSSTFTTVQGGEIAEVKIAPNGSPITEAAGIPELAQERSMNGSIGFTWRPMRELTVTADAYHVRVEDRVVLSGQFDATDTSLDTAFTNALNDLRVSYAQFFANAVNTTNQGIDIVLDYNKRMSNGHIRAMLAANFQNMTIDEINVPEKLNDTEAHRKTFLSDREEAFILASAPPMKLGLTLEYGIGKFTVGTRFTYFGEVELLGYGEDGLGINPMVPTDADPNVYVADRFIYSGKLVPDIYTSWRFSKKFSWHLGVDNFLNVHPDLGFVPAAAGWAFNTETGGPWDAVQMGGNGMRFFTKVSLNF